VKSQDDDLMSGLPAEPFTPPPPSDRLRAALQQMQPVRTRSRFGAFVAAAIAGLVVAGIVLARHSLRRDLAALPTGWVVAAATLWSAAFALSLGAALVPARGEVLPAPATGSRAGMGALLALVVFALCASVEAPGASQHPGDLHMSLLQSAMHCARTALLLAVPSVLVGLAALRRLAPMGGARVGLALGAAGGALGGLVLHFICPIANAGHVLLGHVGGMAVAAILTAVALPLVRARR
jgi:hypothetical protein